MYFFKNVFITSDKRKSYSTTITDNVLTSLPKHAAKVDYFVNNYCIITNKDAVFILTFSIKYKLASSAVIVTKIYI